MGTSEEPLESVDLHHFYENACAQMAPTGTKVIAQNVQAVEAFDELFYLYAPGSKRVTQFQFSVCMYGTCGRIDNKADFDF